MKKRRIKVRLENIMKCERCPAEEKPVGLGKLGRCRKCMRWSATGSLLSWLAIKPIYILVPHLILFDLAIFIAMGFTSLLVAHVVAFALRGATG